jgi:hypothetical protein
VVTQPTASPIALGKPPDVREREEISFRKGGPAEFGTDDGDMVSLWDNFDEAWGPPIPRDMAQQLTLRMVTVYCTACMTTSSGEAHTIESHIRQTLESVEQHKGATLQDGSVIKGEMTRVCTGCGSMFPRRKRQDERHLERFSVAIGEAHKDAKADYKKRYSLTPPTSLAVVPSNGAQTSEPVATETGSPRLVGRRRRGRRGGRRS